MCYVVYNGRTILRRPTASSCGVVISSSTFCSSLYFEQTRLLRGPGEDVHYDPHPWPWCARRCYIVRGPSVDERACDDACSSILERLQRGRAAKTPTLAARRSTASGMHAPRAEAAATWLLRAPVLIQHCAGDGIHRCMSTIVPQLSTSSSPRLSRSPSPEL